jgi:hypothetical protein
MNTLDSNSRSPAHAGIRQLGKRRGSLKKVQQACGCGSSSFSQRRLALSSFGHGVSSPAFDSP